MVDVLLVQPPIEDFYLTYKRTIPHGMACIAAALEQEGFTVEILDGLARAKSRVIDYPLEMVELEELYRGPDQSPFSLFHQYRHYGYSLEYIGRKAQAAEPFLVGISSLFTAYSDMALATAERIRAVCPDAVIAVGGHHPTTCPEAVLDCEAVDYILRGEGEVSMVELAWSLRTHTPVTDVSGIGFRRKTGGYDISPPAIMSDLDGYPLPALHLLRNDYYKRAAGATAVVMTSRGCPMRCSYCSMGSGSNTPYRRMSEERILDEIDAAVESGVRFIDFEDEHLSLKREPFVRILEQLISRYQGLGLELRAMNGLYPPSLDPELVRLMKRAGFRALNLSLCSTSPEQLERFRRPDISRAFDRVLDIAEELGMETVGYIIIGAPDQDPMVSVEDLLFLAQRRVVAGVSVYYPSPGSADFDLCSSRGLLPEKELLYRSSAIPLSGRTSRQDSVTLLRLGRILNCMANINEHIGCCDDPGGLKGLSPRLSIGVELLRMFFIDGVVRGMDPDGTVFEHQTSLELNMGFINGFKRSGNRLGRWHPELLKSLVGN